MKRGDLYRVRKPSTLEPKKYRVFVVVSRQILIDSHFSTVICAPVYTRYDGLSTQVRVGVKEGLKHESSIHCDELVSLPKTVLTNFLAMLSDQKLTKLNHALEVALDLNP
jgi:mRNA interferase MazF